jgi:hypothetical protein
LKVFFVLGFEMTSLDLSFSSSNGSGKDNCSHDVDSISELQNHSNMFGVPDPLFNSLVDVDFLDAHKYDDDFDDP